MSLYDFSLVKDLLKNGIFMRRRAWGSGCFIYYNKKRNKYCNQSGNIIELKEEVYKNTNDWEKVGTHLAELKEKFYDLEKKYNSLKNIINHLKLDITHIELITRD